MSLLYSKDQEYGKYSLEITQELLTKMNEPVIKTASIKNIDEDSSPVYSRPYQLIKAQSEILSIIKVSEEEGEKDEDSKSFGSFSFLGIKQEENCDYSEKDVVMIYVQTKVENLEMVEEVRILQANLIDVTKHKVFIDNEKIVNINKEKMQEIAVKQNSTCDLIKDIIVDITGKLQNEQNIIIVDTDNNEKKNEYIQEQECLRSEETFIDNLEKELENKSKIQKEKELNLEDVSRTDNEIEKQKRTLKNEELIISPEITLEEKTIENINENTQHDLEIQNKITINKLEELSQIKIPENEEFILKNKENLLQTENLQDKIIIPENDNIILNNKENIFQSEFEKIVKIQENEEIVLNEKEIFFQSKEFENKIKISENEELLDKKIVFVSSEDAQIQTEDNNNIVGTIQTNENQSNNIKILDPINNIKASNEAIYFNCDENSDTILQKELNNEEFNLESKNIEKEIYDYPNTHKDGSANFYHNIIDEIKDFDEKNNLKKEKSIQKEFTSTIEADMSINRSLIEENFEKNPNYFDSNISSKLQSEDLGSPYLNELFCNGSPQISHKKNSSCDDDSEDIQLQKATFYQKLATINQFEDKDNNETSQIKKEETEFLEEGIDENKIINLPTDFFNEKKIQQSQNEYNNLEKEHVKNKIYDSKTEEISLKNQESSKEGDSYEKSTAEPGSMILKNSNSCLDDQQSIIIKQGFLYKKSGNFLTGWQKRWFVLKKFELVYYKDEKMSIERGFLKFKLLETVIDFNSDLLISIKYADSQKKLQIKAENKKKSKEWIIELGQQLKAAEQFKKVAIEKEFIDLYWREDLMTEDELNMTAETGDILLFRTSNIPAKLQRSVTGSKYDHVGLLVQISGTLHVLDSQYESGVQLNEWFDFIETNDLYRKVVVRRLFFPNKEVLRERIYEYLQKILGQKYKLTPGKLLQRRSRFEKPKPSDPISYVKTEKHDGFFCSELVAAVYKTIGLLDPNVSAANYWPGSFSCHKQLKFLQGASLSHEISIILNRHLK